MKTLKDLVNYEYVFYSYQNGVFKYKESTGQERIFILIPLEEIGNGQLSHTERGIVLMKWIRKYLKEYEDAKGSSTLS